MERFVQFVVAGGLGLVAGLWLQTALAGGSPAWFGAVGLAAAGVLAMAVGIRMEIAY